MNNRPKGAKYCDEYVCLSVCLSVRSHDSKTTWSNITRFLYTLPIVMDRSSSDGVAIHYVFSIMCMTACFRIMDPWRVITMRRQITTSIKDEIDSNDILLNNKDRGEVWYLRLLCFSHTLCTVYHPVLRMTYFLVVGPMASWRCRSATHFWSRTLYR